MDELRFRGQNGIDKWVSEPGMYLIRLQKTLTFNHSAPVPMSVKTSGPPVLRAKLFESGAGLIQKPASLPPK